MAESDRRMPGRFVSSPVRKKDYKALVTGQPVYTMDIAPAGCLVVKLLRSPHAFARIRSMDTVRASAVPGIACVLTHKDVPENRFTNAGQTYPEPSPYDRRILDEWARYVGDPVAIVAGETEQAVDRALDLIRVDYEVLEPVLDAGQALDHPVLVHPEDNWSQLVPFFAGDSRRNLCASVTESEGDVETVLARCDHVVEAVYQTPACQQVMMEPFCAYSYLDAFGRLTLVASTQIPFHVRRIVAGALGLSRTRVRVIKPRIGGGFGAKQTAVCEVYPAAVTLKTGRKACIVFSRAECMTASSPRHPMRMTVRMGATSDGVIRAIDLHTLSDTGAYGEHGPTTVGLSGHKSLSMYPRIEGWRFAFDVVYTNKMASGAYRGYGATQGFFAIESAVDELAHRLGMDPLALRERNMIRPGEAPKSYDGTPIDSCGIADCLRHVKSAIRWDEIYPRKVLPNGNIRSVGCAIAMQGSGIANLDTASARLTLNDDGSYTLMIGATDMGTGCDTILAQMAADALQTHMENIAVHGVDTDVSPYDKGSYASSTTYVTGNAVLIAADKLERKILDMAAGHLNCDAAGLSLGETAVLRADGSEAVTLAFIGNLAVAGGNEALTAEGRFTSPVSPPPFMAGAAEIELDPMTGAVQVVNYAAAVDCGTVINPNLARVQTEGGLMQAIGMTLYEQVVYSGRGRLKTGDLMQYKIPNRQDCPNLQVAFFSDYENSGPFGAKSVGELVIDTPAPAIANAIDHACGARLRTLPILPEAVLREMGVLSAVAVRDKQGGQNR